MIPYVIFLCAFNYYSIYFFEAEQQNESDKQLHIYGWVLKVCLISFCLYFFGNEYV